MTKNTLACGLILFVALMQPGVIFATDASKKDTIKAKTPIEVQREQTQSLAHKMMGHINLAKFALGLKLPKEAAHHIVKAQTIKDQLESQLPELKINSTFNYGKVTYADKHTVKEHYVPVVDDVLLISDYKKIFEHLRQQNWEEVNAGVVHVEISIDLREVKSALDESLKDINKKEYDKAQNVLTAIFKNAIISEEEIDDPVLSIAENMSLAKAFLDNGQYDKARFTFKSVQKRLANLSGVDNDVINRLSSDLNKFQTELRRKDPTMTESIDDRLDEWRETFREWFG